MTAAHDTNRRAPAGGPDGLGRNGVNWIVEHFHATMQMGTHVDDPRQVALRLATAVEDVPEALKGSQIVLVDPATLLSEAIFASQLEHKVAVLSRNLRKSKAVLFFDEIESFVGSGASSTDEDGDVLNLLLPFLQRPNGVRLLGATTAAGWKRLAQLRRSLTPPPQDGTPA